MRLKALYLLCDKWKDFSPDYFIGDDGEIYRRLRPGIYKRLKSGYYRGRKYGYQQVRNSFGTGKQHTVRKSRACALAFVDNPHGLTDVDHINNDKSDDRADNLQWLSHADNLRKRNTDKLKGESK